MISVGISSHICHSLNTSYLDLWNSIHRICHVVCLDKVYSYFQIQVKFYLFFLEYFLTLLSLQRGLYVLSQVT